MAEVKRQMELDARDFTARFCGDPQPDKSALAKKRRSAETLLSLRGRV